MGKLKTVNGVMGGGVLFGLYLVIFMSPLVEFYMGIEGERLWMLFPFLTLPIILKELHRFYVSDLAMLIVVLYSITSWLIYSILYGGSAHAGFVLFLVSSLSFLSLVKIIGDSDVRIVKGVFEVITIFVAMYAFFQFLSYQLGLGDVLKQIYRGRHYSGYGQVSSFFMNPHF